MTRVNSKLDPERLIVPSHKFVADFTPPDYAFDGIVQRRFIYSMTAPTGGGKTAVALLFAAHKATGWPLGDVEVPKGRVLYLAGENPDDIRMRWIAMSEHLGFNVDEIDVHFVVGCPTLSQSIDALKQEAEQMGGVDFVVVDTSMAYFEGDDENSNKAMHQHGRLLRQLTELPNGPCVIVPCHPTKSANNDNLLPRGGGAFLAEMDGNLVCIKKDAVIDLHTHGKFRGPTFEPVSFQLETVTCQMLKDTRGRLIPTVLARPLNDSKRGELEAAAQRDEDALLILMKEAPGGSIASMARALGWVSEKLGKDGQQIPHKSRVHRGIVSLKQSKLAEQKRGKWILTRDGKREADRVS